MKKWLVLIWLLVPVALLSYHFGPGQDALALKEARQHLAKAQQWEADGQFEAAVEKYADALAALPVADEPSADLAVARDRLRLAQIRGRFKLGRLAESIESLNGLVVDVEREHGANSALAYEVRDFMGRVHFHAMVALRLESAEEDVWRRHWELSRQNFRFLAENTAGHRNEIDRKNLEVVIKSFTNPPLLAAAAAGGNTTTAGLNTVLAPPTTAPPADGSGPPSPPTDARPRPPTPDVPEPVANEFDLGS